MANNRTTEQNRKRYSDPQYQRQIKDWFVRRAYGLTLEEYEKKLEAQGYLCGVCGEPMDGVGATERAPVLDHDHETGKNRDFVHQKCNKGLGNFEDSPKKLRLAALYLEKHRGQ